jgi:DUF1009 family protein
LAAHPDNTIRIDGGHGAVGRLGLIAGWGRYPVVVAEAVKRQGYELYCLGVAGMADPALASICDDFRYLGLGRFGRAIRYFHRHGVTQATMAGKVHKTILFQPWLWVRHLPDLRTIRMFTPHFITRKKDCRDDSLLGMIVGEFASEGIRFGPATEYVPELLVGEGQLTDRGPSAWQEKDVRFGWQVAKEMGRLDIGQSVAVKDQAVLAVEAVEGTDACIRRAGGLCRAGGFTVVKVAKPRQDMRFDVPTIGLGTLRSMIEARAKVLAVEAGRTILVDHDEVVRQANQNALVIVSIQETRPPSAGEARSPAATADVSKPSSDIPESPCPSRER